MHTSLIDLVQNKFYRRFRRRLVDIRLPRPIVSFTFDDFPKNALHDAGNILLDAGFRGTFYLSATLAGEDTECGVIVDAQDIAHCVRAGHELANHMLDHVDIRGLTNAGLVHGMDENRRRFANLMTRNLAYPFGLSNARVQRIAAAHCASGRGTNAGINGSRTDLFDLRANKVYAGNLDLPLELIERNKRDLGWLIFYTHDVATTPSPFGCTIREFECLVEAAANDSEIVTVEEGLRCIADR